MDKNQIKRIIIISIYLLIALIFGAVIYFVFKPDPSCSDGIKNQGETGVDCGGPCGLCQQKTVYQKLEVKSVEVAGDGQGGNDILIKVYNPNEEYGAKSFQFIVMDDQGNKSQPYQDFILPKEEKYIIITGYILGEGASSIQVGIDNENIDWRRAINYQDPKLVIYNDRYELNTTGGNYAKIVGLLVNKSAVDYETIKIKGILRDKNGKFLGGSYHIINTLPANGKREFLIQFPNNPGEVAGIETQAETNIFSGDNYLKVEGRSNYLDE